MKSATDPTELIEVPIRASLWKNVLLAGADRRVTIIIIGTCMVLILLSRFALLPCITAVVLAVFGQIVGIKLANADPQLLDVYLRHINYKTLYLARADVIAKTPPIYPSIPKV